MANVKISALPSYTGSASDLRWLVMNNSGNTETFKYSGYSSPYKFITGTARLAPVEGSNNIVNGDYSAILFGESNDLTSTGSYNALGGYNHTFSQGSYSAIFGGYEHNTTGTFSYSFVGGGYTHQLDGVANAFLGGTANGALNGNVTKTIFGGGQGNTAEGGDRNGFIGGYSNFIYGSEDTTLIGGNDNFILYSNYSSILGGNNNTIRVDFGVKDNGILFGQYNEIKGQAEADSAKDFNTIINGAYNIISGASSYYNSIIGGFNNGIDDGYNSHMIGATGSTISGKTNAVMIGTTNRTALYDNTTHFENTHNFKTESFSVIAGGNVGGSINVDCSLGTIFTFTITANTTPNFINLRDGQRLIFIVNNSGTFSVPTATVGGVSSTVYATGGTLNPTNNGYTKYTATYASGILWIDVALNFQAV